MITQKVVKTVHWHSLVWISLDTQNMWLYSVECLLLRAV